MQASTKPQGHAIAVNSMEELMQIYNKKPVKIHELKPKDRELRGHIVNAGRDAICHICLISRTATKNQTLAKKVDEFLEDDSFYWHNLPDDLYHNKIWPEFYLLH